MNTCWKIFVEFQRRALQILSTSLEYWITFKRQELFPFSECKISTSELILSMISLHWMLDKAKLISLIIYCLGISFIQQT